MWTIFFFLFLLLHTCLPHTVPEERSLYLQYYYIPTWKQLIDLFYLLVFIHLLFNPTTKHLHRHSSTLNYKSYSLRGSNKYSTHADDDCLLCYVVQTSTSYIIPCHIRWIGTWRTINGISKSII